MLSERRHAKRVPKVNDVQVAAGIETSERTNCRQTGGNDL